MTSKSRESRRQAARRRDRPPVDRWLVPAVGIGVIVVAAVLAIGLSNGQPAGAQSTTPPVASGSGQLAAGTAAEVVGEALPRFDAPVGDPAVGRPAPEVAGTDLSGAATTIAADGRPKIVIFLAHWCDHCQAEVPVLQAWVNAGGLPADIDLVSVVTAIDPGQPNYPPAAWLAREGWTVPVIVDPTDAVADAYGLSAFPFWTFIGADGTVRARATGELGIVDLGAYVAGLTGG
jgi:thiol-disulfide isomerase/thioredoxin